MRSLINQYSFVVAGAIVWLALAVVIHRRGRSLPLAARLGAPLALALVLGTAWVVLRPSAASVGPVVLALDAQGRETGRVSGAAATAGALRDLVRAATGPG